MTGEAVRKAEIFFGIQKNVAVVTEFFLVKAQGDFSLN